MMHGQPNIKLTESLAAKDEGSPPMEQNFEIIIIIFINCNWVVTRWQWLLYI
jgi:hypothetical protein